MAARRMLQQVEKLGLHPESLGADKTYSSGEFLAWLLAHGVQPHIPVIDRRHQTRGRFTREQFRYEPEENAYYCPEGKPLRYRGLQRSSRGYAYCSTAWQCQGCSQKKLCTPAAYRKLFVHWDEPAPGGGPCSGGHCGLCLLPTNSPQDRSIVLRTQATPRSAARAIAAAMECG